MKTINGNNGWCCCSLIHQVASLIGSEGICRSQHTSLEMRIPCIKGEEKGRHQWKSQAILIVSRRDAIFHLQVIPFFCCWWLQVRSFVPTQVGIHDRHIILFQMPTIYIMDYKGLRIISSHMFFPHNSIFLESQIGSECSQSITVYWRELLNDVPKVPQQKWIMATYPIGFRVKLLLSPFWLTSLGFVINMMIFVWLTLIFNL